MMEAAIAGGARVQIGRGHRASCAVRERVTGVLVDGAPMEADAVVIAMGPWSLLPASGCRCRWSMG